MPNQILVIAPYWLESVATWVFDDDELEAEGWLCPAPFRYFNEAPEDIYVKAEALKP